MEAVTLIVIGLLVVYGVGNLFTYSLQDYFILRPSRLRSEYRFSFNVPFTEMTLSTPGDGRINALWFRREEEQRPLVFYHHGNSGNLERWGKLSDYFDVLGYDLLIYDYRGFGKSRGRRSEALFYSDGEVLLDFAREYYKEEDIVLYGRSMGSGVASRLAAESKARMLILETPYHSIRKLFATYYPFLPTFLFVFKYRFPVYAWLDETSCPVYVFHGTRDYVIPYRCAKALKPHLKESSQFITVSGGGHGNLARYEVYQKRIREILT